MWGGHPQLTHHLHHPIDHMTMFKYTSLARLLGEGENCSQGVLLFASCSAESILTAASSPRDGLHAREHKTRKKR